MCGIAGLLDLRRRFEQDELRNIASRMARATRLPHFFCHEAPEQDLSREAAWLERPPYYKELGVEMKVDHVWGDCTSQKRSISIGSRICPLLARLTVRLGCQSGYARLPFLSC